MPTMSARGPAATTSFSQAETIPAIATVVLPAVPAIEVDTRRASGRSRSPMNSPGPRCTAFPGVSLVMEKVSRHEVLSPRVSSRPRSAQPRCSTYAPISRSLPQEHALALSPRCAVALFGPREASVPSPRSPQTPRTARLSPAVSPRAASPWAKADASLQSIWHELLHHIDQWRLPGMGSNWPTEHPLPDLARIRRCCQMLTAVISKLQDELLRRVLTVLAEELFYAIFRDYAFTYDPRIEAAGTATCASASGTPLLSGQRAPSPGPSVRAPSLCERHVLSAVPYFAVVQSLRDAAKDAIMRRLELEAQQAVSRPGPEDDRREAVSDAGDAHARAQGRRPQPLPQLQPQAAAQVPQASLTVVDERHDQWEKEAPSSEAASSAGTDKEQLTEELRHARLLVDTYQARTLELERLRIDMEEEVGRMHDDREKDELRRQRLQEEIRRLRAEADASKPGAGRGKPHAGVVRARRFSGQSPLTEEAEHTGQARRSLIPGQGLSGRHAHTPRRGSASGASGTASASAGSVSASATIGSADMAAGTATRAQRASAPTLRITAPARSPTAGRTGSGTSRTKQFAVAVDRKASPKRVAAPGTPLA